MTGDKIKTRVDFTNQEIARLLRKIAAAYEIKGKSLFRIRAYGRAADAIEHATSEVKDLWDDDKLTSIPGVGSSLAQHLDELFRAGKVKHFEKVMTGLPKSIFPLLDIPGIGPKTALKLVTNLKLTDPETVYDDLALAARKNLISSLEGFGEKSQAEILENLKNFVVKSKRKPRIPLPVAEEIAAKYISYLRKNPQIKRADPLGSLRRRVATVGDIDLAVMAESGRQAVERFIHYPRVKKVIDAGSKKASVIIKSGHRVDLIVSNKESYGALLQHFTGSKHHNIHLRELALEKGYSLSEHGIKLKKKTKKYPVGKVLQFSDEESFYSFLGIDWIPPELREDAGEIEAAMTHGLPQLVQKGDIQGDLHVHSNFDLESSHDLGKSSLEELTLAAVKQGYKYIGIADHNPSVSRHSKVEIIDLIKRRNERIDQFLYSHENRETMSERKPKFTILKLLEVDILADGRLAIPEKAFALLDGAIGAIHSSFSSSRSVMTRRLLNAVTHPQIKIIAHPTGRIIQKREGYELEWEKLFVACLEHDVALEINACPSRLDLPDSLVRDAVKQGVRVCINTDAHSASELALMTYGLDVARRGWVTKKSVVNTWRVNQVVSWLKG
jgi:DNA polymerase (family 10)